MLDGEIDHKDPANSMDEMPRIRAPRTSALLLEFGKRRQSYFVGGTASRMTPLA